MSLSEAIFICGGFILSISLLPSVWSDNKPHWKTSLLSGLVLASFTINYLILNFYFAAATGFAQTILWGALFIQVILKNRKTN
jgi:hypothetical protein